MIVTSGGYQGDIRLGDTVDVKFSTSRFSSGASFTLAGTPVVSAYVGNGTTEITSGVTLTVDFDGVTGLHNVRVVASGGNGFAAATNVTLVITTGTVDSVSVVGVVVGSFSIENRPPPNALTLKSLNITQAAGAGDAVTIAGGAASGATPAGLGLKIDGGAASTTGGGVSKAAVQITGGNGAASTNGGAIGLQIATGTTTAGANPVAALYISGKNAADGAFIEASTSGYGCTFTGGSGVGGGARFLGGASSDGDGAIFSGCGNGPSIVVVANGNPASVVVAGAPGFDAVRFTGGAADSSVAAGHGLNLIGGAASTTAGKTAGVGLKVLGGNGAASNNGAGEGMTVAGGGTTTVAGANAISATGTGSSTAGLSLVTGASGVALSLAPGSGGKAISDSAIIRATFAADTGMRTVRSNTLPSQAGMTSVQIKLDASASSQANFYVGDAYYATSGSGDGQILPIVGYDATNKIITVAQAPLIAVVAGDTFAICKAVYGSNTIIMVGP